MEQSYVALKGFPGDSVQSNRIIAFRLQLDGINVPSVFFLFSDMKATDENQRFKVITTAA